MRPSFFLLLGLLGLAGCVQPKAPPPSPRPVPPAPRPQPAPPPAPAANWFDRAPAPGVWTYTRDARGSIAMYGQPGSDALVTVRCEATGARIFVSRPGSVAARLTLRSTNGAKAYDAVPTGGQPPYVAAEIAVRDSQLDSLAFSRGRILIGLDGAPDLVLPIWPEFTRVVEDCRG